VETVIGDGASRVFVVEEAGGSSGLPSGDASAARAATEGELYAIYIVAGSQRKGHGRELVHTMAAALREIGPARHDVWVLRDNAFGARVL